MIQLRFMQRTLCWLLMLGFLPIAPTAALADGTPPIAAKQQADSLFQCSTSNVSLKPTDYLDIDDGMMNDGAVKALADTFADWEKTPANQPLTISIFFHGGLIDRNCGLYYDNPLKTAVRVDRREAVLLIYNVGALESIPKGDAQRGLFKLYDNQRARRPQPYRPHHIDDERARSEWPRSWNHDPARRLAA